MANYFSDEFFDYLASNIDQSPSPDELKSLFDNFHIGKKEKSSSKEKNPSQIDKKKNPDTKKSKTKESDGTKNFVKKNSENTTAKKVSTQNHKCERIPRGKTDPCGKLAKNFIEFGGEKKWYCGTENSGCYHSVLGSSNKKEKIEKSKITTNVPKKSAEDVKAQSLIHKIVKKENVFTRSVVVNGTKVYMHPESRVLFHRNRHAYGILSKDGNTILPIDDENARWLEASNIEIDRKKEKDSDDEESEEEEEDVSEEDDDEDIELESDEDVSDEEVDLDE